MLPRGDVQGFPKDVTAVIIRPSKGYRGERRKSIPGSGSRGAARAKAVQEQKPPTKD